MSSPSVVYPHERYAVMLHPSSRIPSSSPAFFQIFLSEILSMVLKFLLLVVVSLLRDIRRSNLSLEVVAGTLLLLQILPECPHSLLSKREFTSSRWQARSGRRCTLAQCKARVARQRNAKPHIAAFHPANILTTGPDLFDAVQSFQDYSLNAQRGTRIKRFLRALYPLTRSVL